MYTYVALLRGIGPTNPNMHPKKLKAALEKMGFKNVRTVIASGNVVFESKSKNEAALEKKIEVALPRLLGFSSTTIVRSQTELQKLYQKNPFKKALEDPNLYPLVTFLRTKPTKPFPRTNKRDGVYASSAREICTAPARDQTRTPNHMLNLEKHFGTAITSRTWKTVERILKKMNEC